VHCDGGGGGIRNYRNTLKFSWANHSDSARGRMLEIPDVYHADIHCMMKWSLTSSASVNLQVGRHSLLIVLLFLNKECKKKEVTE
jgi:hypothetical protein